MVRVIKNVKKIPYEPPNGPLAMPQDWSGASTQVRDCLGCVDPFGPGPNYSLLDVESHGLARDCLTDAYGAWIG